MSELKRWARSERGQGGGRFPLAQSSRAFSERGQNTVEYLLMLAVIVGVILVIGKMFKPQISGVFNQIMQMISGAASNVGTSN